MIAIGVTHCCDVPHDSRSAVICAVPRCLARNVRAGAEHVLPGRHTMLIGETPGAKTAGLVDVGVEGHGNCSAMTSVPTATWRVVPFCAGVTVIVPCAVLGAEVVGFGGGDGERGGGAEEDRVGEAELLAEVELEGDGEPDGPLPPGSPVVVPVAESDGVPGVVPVP